MSKNAEPVKIDLVTAVLIVMSMVLFLYLTTFSDLYPDLATKSMIGAMILIGGLVGAAVFRGIQVQPNIFSDLSKSIFYLGLAVASIIFAGAAIRVIPLSAVECIPTALGVAFALQMAVPEEVFFRGFLASFFQRFGGSIFGIVGSAGAWMAYHIFVYSTSLASLGFVAIVGVGFGIAFLYSGKNLWITTIVHVVHNLVVGLGV